MTPAQRWRNQQRAERDARILALRGTKPYFNIARELGLTIGTVSGVMFRFSHPRPANPRSRRPVPAASSQIAADGKAAQ
jgi:hypothetical protein